MKQQRGLSQVFFSLLPEQTADLEGRVWRIYRWPEPIILDVDRDLLRTELQRAVSPWSENHDGIVDRLRGGWSLEIAEVNPHRGVQAVAFPEVFRCRTCGRVGREETNPCRCGSRRWSQLHFVAFHDCGFLGPPRVPNCRDHGEMTMSRPQSMALSDIRFQCPVCQRVARGFIPTPCRCGEGRVHHNVHRSASVFTSRTTVIVNPPGTDPRSASLRTPSAGDDALRWVLDGMSGEIAQGPPSFDSVFRMLLASGLDESAARLGAEAALAGASDTGPSPSLIDTGSPAGRAAALELARATIGGRRTFDDVDPDLRARYKSAAARARLESVELVERFPVLTCAFGYTRGEYAAGASRLCSWRGNNDAIRIYAQSTETEALLFRLDPHAVADWLREQGFPVGTAESARDARVALLEACDAPEFPYSNGSASYAALMRLVHSYAHRVIRRLSVLAGIDRESLAEYLVPTHAAFIVYAAARGDFVLGGLQAVFESDLDVALDDAVLGEHRCPLDPGCSKHGGACVACLHLGEPSCRHFNRSLSRETLFGPRGYVSAPRTVAAAASG
jgi:hypothetical protein